MTQRQPANEGGLPTNFDVDKSATVIWRVIQAYREDCIPMRTIVDRRPGAKRGTSMEVDDYAEEWDDICTAMAWLTEAAGCEAQT